MRVHLSTEQQAVHSAACEWASRSADGGMRTRAVRGLAGTGKTVVAAAIADDLTSSGVRVAVVASTGKAAHVLRGKGIAATTVHASTYLLVGDGVDGPEFRLRDRMVGEPDVVVCDEASMLTRDQLADLLRRVPKVLLVGDHGQLPPVSGDGALAEVDGWDLHEVHRQALDSGVVRFAHALREGASIQDAARAGAPDVVLGKPRHLPGTVLVARNDARVRLNQALRKQVHAAHTRVPAWPIARDRVVCLSNHRRGAIAKDAEAWSRAGAGGPWCNGTIADVTSSASPSSTSADALCAFEALCDDGVVRSGRAWLRQLSEADTLPAEAHDRARMEARFAWGWALTVHKAQGSEWDDVLVVGDGFGSAEEVRAWRYTAATRARARVGGW
ncbi:MAG: DUF2075 domain-containing protein [Desulfurellales bacterium]|nr:MAG: DUF2075 domain-containing protein [Desulfurellales bacterium]